MKNYPREDSVSVSGTTGINVTKLGTAYDTMSVVVIGSVTGFFLILLFCVIFLLIKSRLSRKRSQELFHLDSFDDSSLCKSAPISRKSSPKLQKRLSCPNAYGTLDGSIVQTSVYSDAIPAQLIPPQPVQPKLKENLPATVSTSLPSFKVQTTTYHSENEFYDAPPNYNCMLHKQQQNSPSRIMFSATYDVTLQQLFVTLVKVNELPGRTTNPGLRDPFVKVTLYPDESTDTCKTSKTVKQTLNPVYNETFTFNLAEENKKSRFLKFSVYDIDRRRVRHSLGHVTIPLTDIDLTSSTVLTRSLETCVKNGSSSGEISIGLTYLPHLEKLKVIVLRVRNIRPGQQNSGVLTKIHHYYGQKLIKVKQSLAHKAGEDINFNESFAFSTSNRNIENFNFTITVCESRNESLDDVEVGHVNLGSFMFARGAGLIHWQEMMAKTRNIVTKWHPLILQI